MTAEYVLDVKDIFIRFYTPRLRIQPSPEAAPVSARRRHILVVGYYQTVYTSRLTTMYSSLTVGSRVVVAAIACSDKRRLDSISKLFE